MEHQPQSAMATPSSFRAAIAEAQSSLAVGGIPVGAALEMDGELVAVGHNERVQSGDPTAHGEISCLRNAGRQKTYRTSILYTTLAPCAMCAGAIVQFGIPHVVVGEDQTFPGEIEWLRSRGVTVTLRENKECQDLMQRFIAQYPEVWAEDIGE